MQLREKKNGWAHSHSLSQIFLPFVQVTAWALYHMHSMKLVDCVAAALLQSHIYLLAYVRSVCETVQCRIMDNPGYICFYRTYLQDTSILVFHLLLNLFPNGSYHKL